MVCSFTFLMILYNFLWVLVPSFYFYLFLKWFFKKICLRERERKKQSICWAGNWTFGSIPGLWDHDLSWRQMLNQLSHPGSPHQEFKKRTHENLSKTYLIGKSVVLHKYCPTNIKYRGILAYLPTKITYVLFPSSTLGIRSEALRFYQVIIMFIF